MAKPRMVAAAVFVASAVLLLGAPLPSAAETIATPGTALLALEGSGLYQNAAEGALDRDLWSGMKRSEAAALLQVMPASSPVAPTQRLIHGMLLSPFRMALLQNDVTAIDGDDFFTLRIEKLLQGGAYDQAFSLYTNMDQDPYHPRLARAGVMTILWAGKKSLACLEAKGLAESFADDEVLKTVQAFCNANTAALQSAGAPMLARIAAQPSYRFDYTPQSFAALTALEQAALTAERRIEIPTLTPDSVKNIPAAHLQPLLDMPWLSGQNRFLLTARAVAFGVVEPKVLAALYVESLTPAAGDTASKPRPKMPKEEWEYLAALYINAAAAADEAGAWAALRQALPYARRYGVAALAPFAETALAVTPAQARMDELMTGFRLFSLTGHDIPPRWTGAVETAYGPFPDIQMYTRLLLASALNEPVKAVRQEKLLSLSGFLDEFDQKNAYFITNIIENIDNDKIVHNNTDKIYEKEFDLTANLDYVMPTVQAWNRLLQAGTDKRAGETVLLSTIILRESAPQDLYPGLFYDVFASLSSVGLTDISRNLAVTAALGNENGI